MTQRILSDTLRILYVDDEPDLLELGKLYLEKSGDFSVVTIVSAMDALDLLSKEKFDAVVSDYQMPGMDGIEFLKFVRKYHGNIPFILFTGKGREEVVIQALDNGADFYLQKGGEPASQFAELRSKIEKAVGEKQAISAQRDSERRLADIISFLPDATLAIDARGVVLAWNRAMEQMTGVSAGDIIGKGNYEYSLPFYHDRRPILLDLILRYDKTVADNYETIKHDGSNLISEKFIPFLYGNKGAYLWFKASPFYDANGNIAGAIESIRDITDQKKLETSLRASERRYHNVFESAAEAMIVVDRDSGKILDANLAAIQLYGYTLDEFRSLASPDLTNEGVRMIPTDREGKLYIPDKTHRKKDGSIFPAEISGNIYPQRKRTIAIITIRDITERKSIEDALTQSELRYRTLFENLPSGFAFCRMIYDSSGKPDDWIYINVNPAFNRLTGLENITGKRVTDAIPGIKEMTPELFETYSRVAQTGKPETFEIHFTPLGIWLNISVFSPEKEYFVAIFDDITKRRQVEDQLKTSQVQLAEAMHLANLVNWEFDVDSGIFTFDDRFYDLYGTSVEFEGGTWMSAEDYTKKFVHPEDQHLVAEEVNKAIQATDPGFLSHVEHRIIRRDGEIRHIVVRYGITKNEHGRTIKTHGANQDITERKLAEEALERSEREWQTTFDAIKDVVYLIDVKGRIIKHNRAFELFTGKSAEEIDGRYCYEIMHGTTAPINECPNVEAQISRQRESIELNIDNRWFIATVNPILDGNGNISGAVHLIIDITERRRTEEAIRQVNKKLNLLSSITRHDINNQLMVLMGFLGILTRKQQDLASDEYFQKISKAAERISAMIQFTKTYENIGAQAPFWQDIGTLVDTAASDVVLGGVQLENDSHPGTEIFADPLIVKVFYNLVENAVRHGGKITAIRFSVEKRDGDCVIVCEDDGDGVPKDEKDKIFDRGFGKNTGLGLFLSREILAITGITIKETGEPGKGARFEIVVPDNAWRSEESN